MNQTLAHSRRGLMILDGFDGGNLSLRASLPRYSAAQDLECAIHRTGPLLVREAPPPAPSGPRLLDRVREAIRARHYSPRTEKAYAAWIRRFILFHGRRHPEGMGAAEITAFLSSLATRSRVSASTQNQALSSCSSSTRRSSRNRWRGWSMWCARSDPSDSPPC